MKTIMFVFLGLLFYDIFKSIGSIFIDKLEDWVEDKKFWADIKKAKKEGTYKYE